jgi:hypothetical protein
MATRGLQGLFGNTIFGLAQKALDPAFVATQQGIGRGMVSGTFGTLLSDNENPGMMSDTSGYGSGFGLSLADNASPGSSDAGNTSDAAADGGGRDSSGAPYARGGIASLAYGGQSHLGDYSDGGRLLRGPGDGVSDSIPASIGGKRPARLADGEFVVPARIVSELGNGSTEAGARKLYAMMDRIQKARNKTVGKDRVAVNSRAEKNLPA